MVKENKTLSGRRRYQPLSLPHNFSDEEMARDWTLLEQDRLEISKYRKIFRLFIAVQLLSIRLYGRFINELNNISPRIINYLNSQLGLPPSFEVQIPERDATRIEYRKNILHYLGFRKFDVQAETKLQSWLEQNANLGKTPEMLFEQAERFLLAESVLLPGVSVLQRLVVEICLKAHEHIFEKIYQSLSSDIKQTIDNLLSVPAGEQRSSFFQLKEYPPSAKISSLKSYLERYQVLVDTGIDGVNTNFIDSVFVDYLYRLAKSYDARDIKRFKEQKRYAIMVCFLLETRKMLLDHLVKMHDQYILEMCRHSKEAYEEKHREIRKRHKRAVDAILGTTQLLLDWQDDVAKYKTDFFKNDDEKILRRFVEELHNFKKLEERGYGDQLLARYPSLRKYFAQFILLPFQAAQGSESLMLSIEIVRKLDSGELKKLPADAPFLFIPKELRQALKDVSENINRNAWELGLALAIKDALRSGDLYLPQSGQHVSFWNLIMNDSSWKETREATYTELQQPQQQEVKNLLIQNFNQSIADSEKRFESDDFAKIENGKLCLKRYDKAINPSSVIKLQKVIDSCMPSIRIESLLKEVDQAINVSRHFQPIQQRNIRPDNFYKTLLAAIISQATNLGVVAMSKSVKDISVDMLRNILQFYIREETLKAANMEIVTMVR